MRGMEALVAGPSGIFRLGLAAIIGRVASDVRIHETDSFDETRSEIGRGKRFDLVFLDAFTAGLPGNDPSAGLAWLRNHLPDARLLVTADFSSKQEVLRLLDHGTHGLIHKHASADEVVKGVRRVLDGEIWLPRRLLQEKPNGLAAAASSTAVKGQANTCWDRLGDRQLEILEHLADGKTNPQIADIVGLSKYTVRHHVSTILRILNVSNRTEATAIARKMKGMNCAEDPLG